MKKRMAEAPVDLKQPRPKRNRRRTQKVTDNEKQQHEKKKLKTLKPPIIEELDDDAKQEKKKRLETLKPPIIEELDDDAKQEKKKRLETLKLLNIEELDDDVKQPALAGLVSCLEKNSPMKLPPSAAFRLKNQSPSRLVREGQWLKSEPPVTKRTQSPIEGHEADNTKRSIQRRDGEDKENECEEGGEIDKDNGPDEEETAKPLEIDEKGPPDVDTAKPVAINDEGSDKEASALFNFPVPQDLEGQLVKIILERLPGMKHFGSSPNPNEHVAMRRLGQGMAFERHSLNCLQPKRLLNDEFVSFFFYM